MKTPLYKKAFLHSWKLAWKQHALWPLGLFAAALGQMGIIDVLTQSWFGARGYTPGEGWILLLSLLKEGLFGGALPGAMMGWVAFLITVFLSIGVLFLFVSVVSQGALVDITAHSKKKTKRRDVEKSWHVGVTHFWRVFFVHILKKGVIALVGLSVAAVTIPLMYSLSGHPIVFLFVFVLASIVGIIVSFLAVYTVGYIVVEEYSFPEAVVAAWHLFVDHWLVSLEVGVVLFFLNIVVICILVAGLFFTLIPAFVSYFFALVFSSGAIFSFGIAVSATLFLIFLFLVASVFSVFATATWTYLFMDMHKTGLKSHILHWLR